jgi:hypothetical protein
MEASPPPSNAGPRKKTPTRVASEQALAWPGLPVVIVRPAVFLEGFFLPLTGPSVRDRGRIERPFGRGKTPPVAAADVARVVAAVLADPGPHPSEEHCGEGDDHASGRIPPCPTVVRRRGPRATRLQVLTCSLHSSDFNRGHEARAPTRISILSSRREREHPGRPSGRHDAVGPPPAPRRPRTTPSPAGRCPRAGTGPGG